ncbi:hypothetical protein [Methanobrevibacter arboriphilus]|uniref:hypothetical protein n=1 Tax=Methanobrevibacter arboriphilus TaxID=39441 RepID=UPI000AF69F02
MNQHSGKIQIESEIIEKLEGEKEDKIRQIIEKALDEKAEPENVPTLIKSPILDKLQPKMREAAKTIRKAIMMVELFYSDIMQMQMEYLQE